MELEFKVGQRVQTAEHHGHFARGVVIDVDPIGIDGVPYVYFLLDGQPELKEWRPVTYFIDGLTDELCYCHSCCYVFNRKKSEAK